MINVVGAGEDPENLTPATFYSFTPKQKPAPEPVKPAAQLPQAVAPQATPVVVLPTVQPTTQVVTSEIAPEPQLEPEPIVQTPSVKPPQKPKKLLVAGIIGFLVLSIGISTAVYLGQTNQDVRQQASTFQDDTLTTPTDVPAEIEPTALPEPTAEPTAEPTQAVLDDGETLALGATLSPTAAPTPILIDTTQFCGESCNTDDNCQNPAHSCMSGKCKLSSNPVSVSCKTPSGSSQIQWDETQPSRVYSPYAALSGETPQSGPTDWLNYGWAGIGALGIGAALLLFL
jgi:hypothetical protein